ncbi:type II toxin-antitoxin system Phd/YefM family antitoxin [Pseudomonas japonica]|uniref:Antitoxin n=1 Tax=Pseudomonas japonica TaxID=256466 RepID=A0A239C6G5_9PSED|nr:type II toxin-antitoxin system Phd/YefM family antitoxin [Pseudomonas japonica]SNS15519.1 antitoxin YefM [Pseudomonas japonica]
MKSLTIDEALNRFGQTLSDVCREQKPIMITREDGEPVVMLSLREHNSLVETLYLLGNEKNAAWLRESVAQHRNRKEKP